MEKLFHVAVLAAGLTLASPALPARADDNAAISILAAQALSKQVATSLGDLVAPPFGIIDIRVDARHASDGYAVSLAYVGDGMWQSIDAAFAYGLEDGSAVYQAYLPNGYSAVQTHFRAYLTGADGTTIISETPVYSLNDADAWARDYPYQQGFTYCAPVEYGKTGPMLVTTTLTIQPANIRAYARWMVKRFFAEDDLDYPILWFDSDDDPAISHARTFVVSNGYATLNTFFGDQAPDGWKSLHYVVINDNRILNNDGLYFKTALTDIYEDYPCYDNY